LIIEKLHPLVTVVKRSAFASFGVQYRATYQPLTSGVSLSFLSARDVWVLTGMETMGTCNRRFEEVVMETMKAVRIHGFGGPEVLEYETAPRPSPGAGEVLVKVFAAGINPVDWKMREGYRKNDHPMPFVLGWDLSGVVESLGPGTTRFAPGDAVYGRPDSTRDGAYAEYIVVQESEIALKPASIDHIHAAAIPLAGLTAWQALFDEANLQAGQRVLIHAAAGGVGGYAVQLARWKGAYVIGTASDVNEEYVRNMGADEVIDYRTTQFEDVVKDVDVVLDTQGGDVREKSWSVLKKGGILVSIVGPPSEEDAALHQVRASGLAARADVEDLEQMAALVDAGKLVSTLETVMTLPQAAEAQELSKTGHARGRIVLKVAEAQSQIAAEADVLKRSAPGA
jgi:NADPH:quinone reductase-like Zn-dependent oxidoreductase